MMYDASLIKGCFYPVDWLTELTDGSKGVWLMVDRVFGFAMRVEISGVYDSFDGDKPTANCISVWLYNCGFDDVADYEFHKVYESADDVLELGKSLYGLFHEGKSLEGIKTFCCEQNMICSFQKTDLFSWISNN